LETLPSHGPSGRRLTVSLQNKIGYVPVKPSNVLVIAPLINKRTFQFLDF